MQLHHLKNGQTATIIKVSGTGSFRKRILEMGFVEGKKITAIRNAPLEDPIQFQIMDYDVSLRRAEAELITISLNNTIEEKPFYGTTPSDAVRKNSESKEIHIALVGNPNCGKTTLFNYASGSKERVGNYSGVTVDAKEGSMKKFGYNFKITDLPGTYSLSAYSPEERYVRNYISEHVPDIVINVIDSSNLERNLYLTTQLIDMDIKVICALNMYDELEKKKDLLSLEKISKLTGMPMIPIVSTKGKGINDLFQTVVDVHRGKNPIVRHVHVHYGHAIEEAISDIRKLLKNKLDSSILFRISPRYLALKLLENDEEITSKILEIVDDKENVQAKISIIRNKIEAEFNDITETIITDARFGYIAGVLKQTLKAGPKKRREITDKIDKIVTNKIVGFPIFAIFMWIMFQATFSIGAYPQGWIESFVAFLSNLFGTYFPAGMLKDLIIDGIIGGVGGVIVFLPNILILFFFISLMEDTGYMARAVFIMDKLMQKIGLHGKSFIPMIMGFGCNVPAVMATRTIENRNDRMVTMLVNPFMSCGARLPVYVVIISAFFPQHPGSMLALVYGIGVLFAVLSAITLKKTLFKSEDVPFVMELPPYRIPTMKSTVKHMWNKGSQYLKKMGGVIMVASIIIWALGYFPKNIDFSKNYEQEISHLEEKISQSSETQTKLKFRDQIQKLEIDKESERQEKSYIGQLGHAIEPIIRPLGYDWKMGVGIITGLAAKEIVVSTMGVLYNADIEADEESNALITQLRKQTHTNGKHKGEKVLTPAVAFSFMIFVLLYFPCVAVIAAIKRESGSWKWAVFSAVYSTGLAWIVALLITQIGNLVL